MGRTARRWVRIGLGVIADSRDIRRELKWHPHRLMTDRDRLLREEEGEARTLRHTALRRRRSGQPAAAVETYGQLVAARTRAWGADHPLVLDTRLALAGTRAEAGDGAGAARVYEQVLPDLARALGEEHPRVPWARRNSAYWRVRPGWTPPLPVRDELEGPVREAVVLRKEPDGFGALLRLARLRWNQGDEAGAVDAYEQLLAERVRVRGAGHHVVLLTRLTLAGTRARAGDGAGAAQAYERLLDDMVRVLGPRHRGTRWTRRQRDLWRGGAA